MSRFTKQDLVMELAAEVGISRRKTNLLLDHMAQIAYREAPREGFTVPGICRMDVVRRRARKARNPQTGELLLIGEHDALRIRQLKRARDNVAPARPDLVSVLPEEEHVTAAAAPSAAPVVEPQPPPVEPFAPEPIPAFAPPAVAPVEPPPVDVAPTPITAPTPPLEATVPAAEPVPPEWQPLMEAAPAAAPQPTPERLISFRCKNPECTQEIEAPDDMAGNLADCPACGAPIEVPYYSEPGTLHGPVMPQTPEAAAPTMGRTIRIELPDDEDPFA